MCRNNSRRNEYEKNGLDITVLILGIACIGLLTVNRSIFRPVWKTSFRTELKEVKREVNSDLKDSKDEMKEASKEVKEELKASRKEIQEEMKDSRNELKESLLSY